jgi:hypothetical protein
MKKEDLQIFKDFFAGHIATFYGDDEYINANLRLKEDHTCRVCNEMNDITARLNLSDNDRLIAGVIALFHDIGRFTQFKLYQTYSDPKSVDHCKLSVDILNEHKTLDILPADESRIIKTAIRIHGKKAIPSDLDRRIVELTKLIRDADKLDIYHLIIENYKMYHDRPEEYPFENEFPDEPGYCSDIYDSVLNGKLVDYTKLKNLNDVKILKIGWVHDINYSVCLEKISEKGYIDDLFGFLPDNDEIKKLHKSIAMYIDERIKKG